MDKAQISWLKEIVNIKKILQGILSLTLYSILLIFIITTEAAQ